MASQLLALSACTSPEIMGRAWFEEVIGGVDAADPVDAPNTEGVAPADEQLSPSDTADESETPAAPDTGAETSARSDTTEPSGGGCEVDADCALGQICSSVLSKEVVPVVASDATGGEWFGHSVSLSGERALIGARYDSEAGWKSGSAYVFERDADGGAWSQVARLVPDDGAADDQFGGQVALAGDRALVSAFQDDDAGEGSGSAYLFEKHDGDSEWPQVAKLVADDGDAGDNFGISVSLSAHHAIVGAYWDGDDGPASGSVYVFEQLPRGGGWPQVQKLTASDAEPGDWFGKSVSSSGDRLLVGSRLDDDGGSMSGSAYVFERLETGIWSETRKLVASAATAGELFGNSVSLSGDLALIGAEDSAAYLFQRSATGDWSQIAKLVPPDPATGIGYGHSVSLSGSRAVVGARLSDEAASDSGSAYLFEQDQADGSWPLMKQILPSSGAEADRFGNAVALSGSDLFVAAHWDDNDQVNAGTVYTFEFVPTCIPVPEPE